MPTLGAQPLAPRAIAQLNTGMLEGNYVTVQMHWFQTVAACTAFGLLLAACSSESRIAAHLQPQPSTIEQTDSVVLAETVEVPRGRWRLTPPEKLKSVVLWLSHILVRHDEGVDPTVSFQSGDWQMGLPPPQRNRLEALRLAENLREEALRTPSRFGALAQEKSEDVATKSTGGFLGGLSADQLSFLPNVLDAIEPVPIGGITVVVETRWGFHILKRMPPPALETVSGAHIVIGHDNATWLRHHARTANWKRSRTEARELANRIYAVAIANPGRFDELAEQYSEHVDAGRKGDLGSWSSREPTPFPREIATLEALQVGEIAPPIDSLLGFQIIRRTSDRPRAAYTADWILRYFDALAPDEDPTSERSILNKLRELGAQLQKSDAQFHALQKEYCCASPFTTMVGRISYGVESTLASLVPGQIAAEPVKLGAAYLLLRLVGTGVAVPTASAELELPAPQKLDLAYWLPRLNPADIAQRARNAGQQLDESMALERNIAERLASEQPFLGELQSNAPNERVDYVNQLERRVAGAVGAAGAELYHSLLEEQLTELVMSQ